MSSQVRILFPPQSVKCKIIYYFCTAFSKAGVAQLVERQPSKLQVAGSSLVSRSMLLEAERMLPADVAQG